MTAVESTARHRHAPGPPQPPAASRNSNAAPHPRKGKAPHQQKEYRMDPSELPRLIADAFADATPKPNLAGDAYAVETESDLYDMTDPVTRATWTESGLRLFLTKIRAAYGEEFYARITSVQRIESDGTESDAAVVTVDCRVCEGPSTVVGQAWIAWNGDGWLQLTCGHSVKA